MRFLKVLYLYLFGYVDIKIEGFFTERFVNLCFAKGIFLWKLTYASSIALSARISISDFKKLRKIAKQTKCKVEISSKKGLPFLINKYKKRKIFAITCVVIAILIFGLTRFVWNVEIKCDNLDISADILKILNQAGIKEGVLISKVDTHKAINLINLSREDISWCGIKIAGTNVIVSIEMATKKPEILDPSVICDIISDKEAVITKITTLNGTSIVKEGDTVKPGDVLVRGVVEGKYTDPRPVHADAKIEAKVWYTKEEEQSFIQEYYETTENTYNNFGIKFNNFKINFNKRLPKFKKYDTIETNKKIKLFSNFYIPVEFVKVTYTEKNLKQKEYTMEELSNELQEKLKNECLKENNISKEDLIDVIPSISPMETGVKVKITCVTEEEIGMKKQIVY